MITSYKQWQDTVSDTIKGDLLWELEVYRFALFVGDLGWYDVTKLDQDRRTQGLANQLYRALGSISANIAEGYGRQSSKDQARFYEYALGSARESRDWYHKAQHILPANVVEHRLQLLTSIIKMLLPLMSHRRQKQIKETSPTYQIESPYLFNIPY